VFNNSSSYRITESEKLMKRMHVIISGRVQGVFFRAETQRAAKDFSLTGWVRNMADGRVETVFEGENANVDKMLSWCHIGPPAARVEKVMTAEEPYTGEFSDFSIKYL
jgi:acylphosphatase